MIVFRYLLKEVALALAVWTVSFLFLFLALSFLKASELVLGSAVRWYDIVRLIGYLLPQFVVQALPISFLLALLLSFGRLSEDNELKALQASGLSPARLMLVPVLIGAAASVLLTVLAFSAQPWAARRLKSVVLEVIEKNVIGDVKAKTFYEGVLGLTLYAETVPQTGPWRNVLVFNEADQQGQWLTLATQGQLVPSSEAPGNIEFQLLEGEMHRATSRDDEYSVLRFARARVLGGIGEAVSRGNSLRFSREESTPVDLWNEIVSAERTGAATAALLVSFHWRLAQLVMPLAFALVGTALCFVKRSQGRGLSVLLTLVCYVSYYVLGRVLTQLGERGAVPPVLAGHLGNVIFLGLGLYGLRVALRRGAA